MRTMRTNSVCGVLSLLLVSACGNTTAQAPEAAVAQDGDKATKIQGGSPNPTPTSDAVFTDSGLAYVVLTPGRGEGHPKAVDRVKVHYTGWTTDGVVFDSSYLRGEPATFPLNAVIAGWTEGLQLMIPGEKRRFWIPSELAYGKSQNPTVPKGTLIFDVELLEIERTPEPPSVPDDVAAPPESATRTESGLHYRQLTPGKGSKHPGENDRVEVHYSGWTTNGKMFDSSVMRGQASVFPLSAVIKGWTEGLQLMVEGESMRFWIPAALAYGENPRPGAPSGMLVFDVELVAIR